MTVYLQCQRCGATPPVFYSRELATPERLCAACMRGELPGWLPPEKIPLGEAPHVRPAHERLDDQRAPHADWLRRAS